MCRMKMKKEKMRVCENLKSLRIATVLVALVAASAFAWPWSSSKDKEAKAIETERIQDSLKNVELKNLQREIDALARIRLQKADSLEKMEAEHWRKRYAESQLTEEHEASTRELDGRYSKLSTDLGRVSEEVMASKNVTTDAEDKAKTEESAYDAFHTQVSLSLEKTASGVTGDYPIGMNSRLVRLKAAQNEAANQNPNTLSVMQTYLEDLLARHELTYTQTFGDEISQVGNRPDVHVNRLRLGTVFLGEVAPDNGDVQVLLRTGALQGKVFEWSTTLPAEMSQSVRGAVQNANEAQVTIPLDVLQNKAMKNSIAETKEMTLKESLLDWFKKGGVVMYPLLLAAFFALLLSLERFIVLMYRGRIGKRFMKKLNELVDARRFEDAANLCLKKESSLSMVLFSVLNKVNDTRESAERALQESLLREQPKLDRRMGLLAAVGTIAPLLGLLGTVTGIITLFTVITEVGTNDARVLAGGISEALITTEAGLVIAIPTMILHGLLSEKIDRVTSELYVQSTAMLNRLFPKS